MPRKTRVDATITMIEREVQAPSVTSPDSSSANKTGTATVCARTPSHKSWYAKMMPFRSFK
eukprot:scaffold17393_cov54-Phaeocystis_antarctica.AAC.4